MAEVKAKTAAKAPKLADPIEASIEVATQEMIAGPRSWASKRFSIGQ